MAKRKKKQGGQPRNINGFKRVHGSYRKLSNLDGRTREGKIIKQIEAELATAMGAPTPQEILLIQRVAVKALKCHLAERHFLGNNGNTVRLEKDYLSWTNSLRADLQLLGLQRRAKPVQDLQAYLKENHA